MVDMSTAIEATDDESYQNVDVIGNWPVWGTGALRTTLDKSQFAALHTILSKRLAVVQGPPGTGKTHVSVVALKVLLANWRIGDPPIIVSCQTNHALDQLLRLVSVFEENFIRLGGRSKDTGVVREHTLYEIRMKRNSRPTAGGMAATSRARMNKLSKDISLLLNPLELGSQMLIDPNKLTQLGILTPEQGVSMQEGDQGYVNHNLPSEGAAPMSAWLGSQLQVVGRNLQKDDNYDYEEAELEFEDLQEIEAEAAAQDDENLEALTGQTYSIADNFTGRKQTRLSDSQIESLLQNQNLYDIPMKQRGSVYAHMQLQAKRIILKALREVTKEYNGLADQRRIGRFEQDLQLLREQKLIGVTTTGLSKYRPMLSALNPKIVLVEEAAETIEAPVAAACVPSLQHLILVGDHQQLRPQCSVKSLEGQPFNLNVSLFERMVLNEVEFSMLKRQRRMIPEVRRLLRPIYGKAIVDHPIVKSAEHRPPIPGMGGINSYFFTHEWMEERDENLSAFNRHEANMVAAFYNYLTYNGMEASQITVITFYNGQRKAIIKAIHRYPNLRSRTLKVVTVDSYQGEENEVILLSLVRSNEHYSIGFLNVDNRVCVALSRARRGFYLFGNAEILCSEHETWAEVVRIMAGSAGEKAPEPKKRIAFHLPLFCDKHQRKTFIEEPDDFDKINGGCEIVCGGQLPCGHPCELKCHPFDHSMVICDKPCIRNMECGHKCINDCGDPCRCAECRDNDSGDEPMETIQPQLQALSMNQAMYPGSIPISGTTAFGNPTGCYGSAPFGGTTLVTKRNLSGGTAAWNAFADGGYVKQDRKLFDNPHKTFDKWYGKLNRGLRTSSETLATSGTGSSGASRMAPKTPSPPSSFNSASLKKAIPLADSALSKPLVKAAEEAPTVIESVDTDEDIVERLQDSMSERKVFTTEVNLIDFD